MMAVVSLFWLSRLFRFFFFFSGYIQETHRSLFRWACGSGKFDGSLPRQPGEKTPSTEICISWSKLSSVFSPYFAYIFFPSYFSYSPSLPISTHFSPVSHAHLFRLPHSLPHRLPIHIGLRVRIFVLLRWWMRIGPYLFLNRKSSFVLVVRKKGLALPPFFSCTKKQNNYFGKQKENTAVHIRERIYSRLYVCIRIY